MLVILLSQNLVNSLQCFNKLCKDFICKQYFILFVFYTVHKSTNLNIKRGFLEFRDNVQNGVQ